MTTALATMKIMPNSSIILNIFFEILFHFKLKLTLMIIQILNYKRETAQTNVNS